MDAEKLALLRKLQGFDEEIAQRENAKKKLLGRRRIAEKKVHEAARKAQTEKDESKNRRAQIDKLEVDLKSKENKVDQLNIQLNTAKTNKEYSALQHEIATIKADASLIEDQLLSLMDEAEDSAQQQKKREEEIKAAENQLNKVDEEIQRKAAENDGAIQKLKDERQNILQNLDVDLRVTYERLMRSKNGKAVVKAPLADSQGDDRICSGCFMRLTSNTTSMLMRGDLLVRCHSCGRILFIDPEESNEEEQASEPQSA